MAYKVSDYIPSWSVSYTDLNVYFGAETHVSAGVMSAMVFRRLLLLEHSLWPSLVVHLSGKAHKDSDYTAMIDVVHWCLGAETHQSYECFNNVLSSF